jgi:hypothetical protein
MVREFLTPQIRAYFNQTLQGGETVEGESENIVVYKPNKKVDPGELDVFLRIAGGIAEGLFALAPKQAVKD